MLVFTGAKRYHLAAMTAISPKLGAAAPPCLPVGLVAEFLENPICLETRTPRLSWRLDDSRTGARQTAYRIAAASSEAKLESEDYDLWDTGNVESDNTLDIQWGAAARTKCSPHLRGRAARAPRQLRSRSSVFWRVMV